MSSPAAARPGPALRLRQTRRGRGEHRRATIGVRQTVILGLVVLGALLAAAVMVLRPSGPVGAGGQPAGTSHPVPGLGVASPG